MTERSMTFLTFTLITASLGINLARYPEVWEMVRPHEGQSIAVSAASDPLLKEPTVEEIPFRPNNRLVPGYVMRQTPITVPSPSVSDASPKTSAFLPPTEKTAENRPNEIAETIPIIPADKPTKIEPKHAVAEPVQERTAETSKRDAKEEYPLSSEPVAETPSATPFDVVPVWSEKESKQYDSTADRAALFLPILPSEISEKSHQPRELAHETPKIPERSMEPFSVPETPAFVLDAPTPVYAGQFTVPTIVPESITSESFGKARPEPKSESKPSPQPVWGTSAGFAPTQKIQKRLPTFREQMNNPSSVQLLPPPVSAGQDTLSPLHPKRLPEVEQ